MNHSSKRRELVGGQVHQLHSLSSFMTLAFARSLTARHSRDPHHPFPMGEWFHGFTGSRFRCGRVELLGPRYGSDQEFPPANGDSTSGITTVITERLHRSDSHPLENQLASLHRLFHPLLSCRFTPAPKISISLKIPEPSPGPCDTGRRGYHWVRP